MAALPERREARGGPQGLLSVGWSFPRALLVGLVTNIVVAQLVVGVIGFLIVGITSADDPRAVPIGLAVDLAWLGAMLVWLHVWHAGWPAAVGVAWRARDAAAGVGYGLLLTVLVYFAVAWPLTELFRQLWGSDVTTPDQLPSGLSTGQAVAALVLAVIVAPITEELYFRGILFRSIRDKRGFWLGAIVSAAIFGLLHSGIGPSPWRDTLLLQLTMTFTGVALAWIYERRGNLVSNIAAHMTFNAIGMFLILTSR